MSELEEVWTDIANLNGPQGKEGPGVSSVEAIGDDLRFEFTDGRSAQDVALPLATSNSAGLLDPVGAEKLSQLGQVIPDGTNSWWSWPDAVYDPDTERAFVTMGTHGGSVKIAWWDRLSGTVGHKTVSDKTVPADDHYTRALLVQRGREALAFGTYHDKDAYTRVIRSKNPGEFEVLHPEVLGDLTGVGLVSYGSILQKSDDLNQLGFIFRIGGGSASGRNYVQRSTDGGQTLRPAGRFVNRPYLMVRRNPANGDYNFLACTHTTQATNQIHFFAMSSQWGQPRNAARADASHDSFAGTNLWQVEGDTETPFVDVSKADLVSQRAGTETQRVLDMFPSARRILICVYPDRNNMAGGGEYRVLSRQVGDTTNQWSEEPIAATGKSFYAPSGYVPGGAFLHDGSLVIAREESNVWRLERWTRPPGTWVPQTWQFDRTLYTAEPGVVLARPRVFYDCNTWEIVPGLLTFGEYKKWTPSSFRDTYGNQKLIRI